MSHISEIGIPEKSSITVQIPAGVNSVGELISSIATQLKFPYRHAENWNALFDTLCDLSWVPQRTVIINHEGRLELLPEQLTEYYRVLNDSMDSWRTERGDHELIVHFPAN